MMSYHVSNQVELELCKLSRVGGQIFILYSGSHTSTKRHHIMYYNKPEFTIKVFNFNKQYSDQQQESNNRGNNEDESTATNIDK